ncbi:MAG: hypothetical protein RLZ98_3053 [Pseudomonadota bacterium]
MTGSPFWNFSLGVYGTPGVPDACIRLQDEAGVDVNVMLYLLWLAGEGRKLDLADVRAIVEAVDGWRADVVVPLRTARRALKSPPGLLDTEAAAALRTKVKAIELEAERLQQEALYAFRPAREIGAASTAFEDAAGDNLAHYAKVLAQTFDANAQNAVIKAAMAKAAAGR